LIRITHANHDSCLAYVDGMVYAIADMSNHEEASLTKDSLHGDCAKYPLRGSRFKQLTGETSDEPAEEQVNTYDVTIDDDVILIKI